MMKMTPSGKAVTHSKPASLFGNSGSARMPAQQPPARIPVPKATCKVCPGANRKK